MTVIGLVPFEDVVLIVGVDGNSIWTGLSHLHLNIRGADMKDHDKKLSKRKSSKYSRFIMNAAGQTPSRIFCLTGLSRRSFLLHPLIFVFGLEKLFCFLGMKGLFCLSGVPLLFNSFDVSAPVQGRLLVPVEGFFIEMVVFD